MKLKYDRKRGHWYPTCQRGTKYTRWLSPGVLPRDTMKQVCDTLQIPEGLHNYELVITIDIKSCRVKWNEHSATYNRCYKHKKKD